MQTAPSKAVLLGREGQITREAQGCQWQQEEEVGGNRGLDLGWLKADTEQQQEGREWNQNKSIFINHVVDM